MNECEHEWEWEEYSGFDVHSIMYDEIDRKFEALVNATVKCTLCGKTHELCMSAKDEVNE